MSEPLTTEQLEVRRQNLKAFREELEMEGEIMATWGCGCWSSDFRWVLFKGCLWPGFRCVVCGKRRRLTIMGSPNIQPLLDVLGDV